MQGDTLPREPTMRGHGCGLEAVGEIRQLEGEIDAALRLARAGSRLAP